MDNPNKPDVVIYSEGKLELNKNFRFKMEALEILGRLKQ